MYDEGPAVVHSDSTMVLGRKDFLPGRWSFGCS